jgi:SAM-dependent methyltransferase
VLDAARLMLGERVLDVACGTGGVTLEAAHRVGAKGAAAGIDADADAIRVAKTRAREQLLGWTSFAVGELARAELPSGAFDAVVSRFGISSLADPDAALSRLSRALAPGGRVSFVCWRGAAENLWFSLPRLVVVRCFGPDLGGALADTAIGARPFALADRELVLAMLGRAGFVQASVEPLEMDAWVGDDVDDALEFFYETVGRPLDDRLDAKSFERLTRELRSALAERARPDGVWLPAAAWLVRAQTRS